MNLLLLERCEIVHYTKKDRWVMEIKNKDLQNIAMTSAYDKEMAMQLLEKTLMQLDRAGLL